MPGPLHISLFEITAFGGRDKDLGPFLLPVRDARALVAVKVGEQYSIDIHHISIHAQISSAVDQ